MNLPILFNHDPQKPIGRCEVLDDHLVMIFPNGIDADVLVSAFSMGSAWRVLRYERKDGAVLVYELEVTYFGVTP